MRRRGGFALLSLGALLIVALSWAGPAPGGAARGRFGPRLPVPEGGRR